MKDIRTVRRMVATMANQLHKLGYSLSNAFRTAWRRIKESMTCRVSGVTYGSRQQLLRFISGRSPDERANTHDRFAVAVVVGISGIGYAHIGYLPKGISRSMAALHPFMDDDVKH